MLLALDPQRRKAVEDAEDAALVALLDHHDLNRVRGGGEKRHHLGHLPEVGEHVDGKDPGAQHHQEEVPRAHRERVLHREPNERVVRPRAAHQALLARLVEGEAELDPGHRVHHRLVHVLHRLDEVGVAEDDVDLLGLLDRDQLKFHASHSRAGPRRVG